MYYNNDDKYEGDWKNNKKEEKELYIIIMLINMKVILKMIIEKEKE